MIIRFIIPLLLSVCIHAQTITVKYYADEYCRKEVKQDKANFSQTTTSNCDTTKTEVRDLKTNEIVNSYYYKGLESIGVWTTTTSSGRHTLDFDFTVVYDKNICDKDSSAPSLCNYYRNDSAAGYTAPIFTDGYTDFNQYLVKNIRYPRQAKDDNLMGTVYLTYTITSNGNVENVVVNKGVNIMLDKEAVRVVRGMKFSSPPKLNGQPVSVCITTPIRFQLM